MPAAQWRNAGPLEPKGFVCGHCNLMVGTATGYSELEGADLIYLCSHCGRPSYFHGDLQVPGVAYGNRVDHLPPEVQSLYTETRNCMVVAAYTASVLACRKLLMNVAVSQGAPPNDTFQNYVSYLSSKGYVPPNATGWVDKIRKKGNEATHEIPQMGRADAEDLITFMEMILKLIFEFPMRAGTV